MGVPIIVRDRVLVPITTISTGTYQLSSAFNSMFRDFAGFTSGDRIPYVVEMEGSMLFEEGEGIYTAATPSTLTRLLIKDGSAGPGTPVNWPAGTKLLYVVVPADRLPLRDTDGFLSRSIIASALLSELSSSSAVTIPHNTNTVMAWNLRTGDSLAGTSGSTPWYGVTTPIAGTYRATSNLNFAPTTAGTFRRLDLVAGAEILSRDLRPASQGTHHLIVGFEKNLAAGVVIQVQAMHDAGSSITAGGNSFANFTVVRL